MASALLASRNEPYWGERKVYMRKNPNPNSKLCPNPNPNPNFKQNPNGHETDEHNHFQPMDFDEPAAPMAAAVVVSDDSSSFVRKPVDLRHRWDSGGYVTFNISAYSKQELRELKRRLILELEQVRSVTSRIASREFQSSVRSAGYSTSSAHVGGREVSAAGALPAMAGSDALIGRSVPNADQLYSPNDIKKHPETTALAAAPELKKLHTAMMKRCAQILTKLMRHKGGVWFNTPVDVVGMGLHDYHQIIKNPMDLGTVKSKLGKGFYLTPLDFASDIRLTFNNALVYNPQGHDVHSLADVMLRHFEGSFGPAYDKYEKQRSAILRKDEEERQRRLNYSRLIPVPEPAMRAEPSPVETPKPAPPPLVQPHPKTHQHQQAAIRMPKQPKPKANDPNKREMSMEEKQKLGAALQDLPEDKMTEVLQIVSKRNETQRNGDEVEIDFELMDTETLWELDRFVANWNKMVSKIRKQRQEMLDAGRGFQDPLSVPAHPHSVPCSDAGSKSPVAAGEAPEAVAAKKMKRVEPVEEEIDIGDEMPANHYPPVEIGKAESSSGSSGGSDSSSSSGTESESSSGSDSDDEDKAQSPAVGSRRSPRS